MSLMGFTSSEWSNAIEEITKILSLRAHVEQTVSYSELVSGMKSIQIDAHDPRLGPLLGEVSARENEAGRGMLTVLVVHKTGDKMPGPGFFELATRLGYDVSDREAFWLDQLRMVFAAWR